LKGVIGFSGFVVRIKSAPLQDVNLHLCP
jgi:hypothetical protein